MQQPWPEVPAHLGAPRWVAIDCVVAALGLAIVALLSRAQLGPGGPTWADGVIIGASLAAAGLRRRWPRAVLPLIVVLGAAATWTGASAVVAFAVAFVMYLIPQRFARREALWLLAGTLVATAIAATASLRGLLGPPGPPSRTSPGLVVVGLLVITVAWTIGYAVQQQRLHAAARQEQAAQQAHEALAEARRAMSEERLRIARELHDVVAHTLSVIAVQAGVANHVAAEHPGEAQRALSSIEETSRGALQEMRALLGVLRGEEGSAPDVFGAAPAPGLDDLDALVERAGEAGVRVDLQIRGTRADLSAGLELAAYRVVQEAITNVIKHSGADGCRVTVAYHREVFTVEVADDGANPAGPAAGHGIAGMRERVAMYGGEFHAGPASPRGFRIAATFPAGRTVIRVLVADDQALVRGSFRLLVDTAPDLEVVAEAATGAEAVDLAKREQPDVILMDIRMPVLDGIEATRRITSAPDTASVKILILTTFDVDEYVFAALRAGASGFLLKDTRPADLLAGIRIVAEGEALLAPSVTRRLIEEFTRNPPGPATEAVDLGETTAREREVLTLVGLGLSNTEIAERLHVSLSTAKTHVGRLLMKLGARDRAQLVIAAYRYGLVRA